MVLPFPEVGTDQQEDDPGSVEMAVNLPLPFEPGGNLPVVPFADDPLPLEDASVLDQVAEERLILVGVGVEDFNRVGG